MNDPSVPFEKKSRSNRNSSLRNSEVATRNQTVRRLVGLATFSIKQYVYFVNIFYFKNSLTK